MIPGMTELFAVLGVTIIGHIGSTVLVKIGHTTMAGALDIIVYLAGMAIAMKVFWSAVAFVKTSFGLFF